MDSSPLLRYIIAGRLRRDFILPPEGNPKLDIPGGGLLYSASGLAIWDTQISLLGRVGSDYPQSWLDDFSKKGFDTRGIPVITESIDQRAFYAYTDNDHCLTDNPISHFARRNLPFPKELLGYASSPIQQDNRNQPTPLTIRLNEIPDDYLDGTAAHLCPIDYLSHSMLTSYFKQGHVGTLTLDPSPGYMTPLFWEEIPAMLRGITAFLCSESKLRGLFQGRSSDLWEIAETLAGFGCEIIVIKRGGAGQYLYDHASGTRWIIPAYPTRIIDPTGAGDAFCGGFLAGYRNSYDPLESTLCGNISASMIMEGSGPFYALEAIPGLAQARLEHLRNLARKT